MSEQPATGHLYKLIFEGVADDRPETLQRLKGVFIADLDLTIPEVQRILNEAGSQICSSDDQYEILQKEKKLKLAGALVHLIGIEQDPDEAVDEVVTNEEASSTQAVQAAEEEEPADADDAEYEVSDESENDFELEFELDQLEIAAPKKKKKREKVHVVSEEVSLDDTLKELGLDNIPDQLEQNSPAVNGNDSESDAAKPLFEFSETTGLDSRQVDTAVEPQTNAENTISTNSSLSLFADDQEDLAETAAEIEQTKVDSDSATFEDLSLQDPADTMALVENLVPADQALDDAPPPAAEEIVSATINSQEELSFEDEKPEAHSETEIPDSEAKIDESASALDFSEAAEDIDISELSFDEPASSKDHASPDATPQLMKALEQPSENPTVPAQKKSAAQATKPDLSDVTINKTTRLADLADAVDLKVKPLVSGDSPEVTVEPQPLVIARPGKASRIASIPWDILLPIVIGAAILGLGNYYYFSGQYQNKAFEQQQLEKNLKETVEALNEESVEGKRMQRPQLQPGLNLTGIMPAKLKVVGTIIKIDDGYLIKNLEIRTPRPMRLTDEEIIAGREPRPWLSKIHVGNLTLKPDPSGRIDLATSARAYIVMNKVSQRYTTSMRIVGNFNSAGASLALKISVGSPVNDPEQGYFIEKRGPDDFNYGAQVQFVVQH